MATLQLLTGFVGAIIDAANKPRMGLGYTLAFLFASFVFLAGSVMVMRVKGST